MREIFEDIDRWVAQGRRVALARVVALDGSGPRDPGAAMAVSEDGEVAGSVSGGCVEGAVVTEALDALSTGLPRLCTFGFSDEDAFSSGLTCGGVVHVFVEPLVPDAPGAPYVRVREWVRAGVPCVLATIVELADAPRSTAHAQCVLGATVAFRTEGEPVGSLGGPDLDRAVAEGASDALRAGRVTTRHYGRGGEADRRGVTVFFDVFAPPRRMIVLGAVDFTAALVQVAKLLDYRVTVCDARPAFATTTRFPAADVVVVDWPHRHLEAVACELTAGDAICLLTHDEKFDVPAIVVALRSAAGYIGAMGSRGTHARRLERLRSEGVSDADCARVMAPIGVDIGARTPEETAIAICAEIIAVRTGSPVPSLRSGAGPIHRRSAR